MPKLETINCPICFNSNHKKVSNKARFNEEVSTSVCLRCGLSYINPRMDAGSYDEYYRAKFRQLHVKHKEINEDFLMRLGEDKGEHILKSLDSDLPQDAQILDVGCGTGALIYYLGLKGFTNLTGIDHSINEYNHLDLIPALFYKDDLKTFSEKNIGQYDLVILSHVLEHFIDPVKELKRIRQLLKPQGHLFVEVPDLFRPYHGWSHFFQKPHTFNFCQKTLDYLWQLTGFKKIKYGHHIYFLYNLLSLDELKQLEIDEGLAKKSIEWITKTEGDITSSIPKCYEEPQAV